MVFLKVNMTTGTVDFEPVPEDYRILGGRGLTSRMINEEVPPDCDPLGPDNKLIFAPGYLSGTPLVNTSRLSIGAKSPLTGGIKESNVGGTAAADLAGLGIRAVIVEGKPAGGKLHVLKIESGNKAELTEAGECAGLRTYAAVDRLRKTHGDKIGLTLIGPAGERMLNSASIQTTDVDGRPCRAAGRGGLGAVMASKGLKALVVARGGRNAAPLADPQAFGTAAKAYARDVRADEFSAADLPEFGSALLVAPINAAGGFPTRNAREGQFEGADKIGGEALAAVIEERGGVKAHRGCSQCIVRCSNVYVDPQGRYVTSSLEYETIWSMGAMIGVDDLDIIARLDFLCDDIGLDTIGTGVAIAVAMDAGYREFGDGPAAIKMVEEVAQGTEMGRIIGNGPAAVGEHFLHDRVPVMKGQSMAAYDPRAFQGMAVTYATTPMGGDHTAGWVVDQNLEEFGGTLDRFSAEGQVEASRDTQIHMAAVDTVGICDFAQTGLATEAGPGNVNAMIAAKSGLPFGEKDWLEMGQRVIRAELDFNRRAGFTSQDDRLPEMFYKEPLPPHNKVVIISNEEMDSTFAHLK